MGEEKKTAVAAKKKTGTAKAKSASASKMLRIRLVRSVIGHPRKHREVVRGLGLRRTGSEVLKNDCPEIRGMIQKISYLLKVEELEKK
ncbi:MAG: 50S ribosomal protein L30 [Candidatus Aminicenantes bacterium]|nr:50S ribosomal protein L30 [Candidatus Aminicenantes bacterium]